MVESCTLKYVLRRVEGRRISTLGDVIRHDLLGEVAVDGRCLRAGGERVCSDPPKTIVLVFLFRGQISRCLIHGVRIKHAVAVRNEDTVCVLDNLQVPVGEEKEGSVPGKLRTDGDHDMSQCHVGSVHRRHVLVADLREEGILHDGDVVKIATFLVRLQVHRLLDRNEVILWVVVVVATALCAKHEATTCETTRW